MDAKRIIDFAREKHGVVIVRDYNEPGTEPELTEGYIRLNGEGKDGHETFYFVPVPDVFDFCKTAEKPYDAVVCAVLLAAQAHYGAALEVSSDGYWDREWSEGRKLFTAALGVEPVKPPRIETVAEWDARVTAQRAERAVAV